MYQISITKKAKKELAKIPNKDFLKIIDSIEHLADNPFPSGYKELKGYPNHYRIRQGNYRVIYVIHNEEILITIIKVGHRKDVYEAF